MDTEGRRGQHKIFLGYAPGVGATTAMLQEARRLRDKGVKVVVGYVEPHVRSREEGLLGGLEMIPPRLVEHRGRMHREMDLDALLARGPEVVVVDVLAHNNAPGSRHPRRFQDVDELLRAGIDVYSTLSIEQLDSLTDVVAQITGATIDRTVPDRVFDEADTIQIVDLPPQELIERIEMEQIGGRARGGPTAKFFRPGNLAALRELTFRRAAQHVDERMRRYMQQKSIPGPWPAGDHLLVCVSPSPLSERLVRAGRRLAMRLDAPWTALYVETPAHARLSETERDRVAQTLHLAQSLGAKAVTLPGNRIAETVAEYARQHNITKIVAGKPLRSRWLDLVQGSLLDQIVRHSGAIDVYVISSTEALSSVHTERRAPRRIRWRSALWALLLVVAVTLLGMLVERFLAPTNLVMGYLLIVVIAAIRLGRGPASLAALLSVLAFDVFFVPPRFTIAVEDAEYLLTFGALLGVGLIISRLAAQAQEQATAARRREVQTVASYELSRTLAAAVELEDVIEAVIGHVSQTLNCRVLILMPTSDTLAPANTLVTFDLDEQERAAATWAFEQGQAAGQETDTLPSLGSLFLPLHTAQTRVGVLGVRRPHGEPLTPEQRRLLETFASQAAVSIERVQLAKEASEARLLRAKEQLQSALLNSISHELRTPLATVTGALSTMIEDDGHLNVQARRDLIETAYHESNRLNRLVANLLDMARLEAGAMRLAQMAGDVADAIGVALSQFQTRLGDRQLRIDLEDDLPLVQMDFVLIVQVLVNLIDNAIKYAPSGTCLTIRARRTAEVVEISVADEGVGIPPDQLKRVFDKFYRVPRQDDAGGTGLGLSISRGVVEAHGGRIWATSEPEGGTEIHFTLPLTGHPVALTATHDPTVKEFTDRQEVGGVA